MRILFTFVGGSGHFIPLVPIVETAIQRGHEITVVCPARMQAVVESAGFPVMPLGSSAVKKPERTELLPMDVKREENDLREKFARLGAPKRAEEMIPVCKAWKPDILVCDETDFGSMIVAEALGILYVTVQVIASGAFIRPDVVADPLNQARANYDLPPDPNLDMLSRYLYISPMPPSFRHPSYPAPETAHYIKPFPPQPPSLMMFEGFDYDNPIVYFTLGTVFNMESGNLFSRVLDGLKQLPINVVVTVGRHIDPAEFGEQPDSIHIAQYIPQLDLLPHVDLVVSHGGSGSVIATLAHGLPMVLIPMGADQLHNAHRCEALNVSRTLDAVTLTPDLVADAVSERLRHPVYRQASEKIRDEIAGLPEPAHAMTLIERLADEKQPLLSKIDDE